MQMPNPGAPNIQAKPARGEVGAIGIAPRALPVARGITWRSIALGFVLSVVHACWVIYEELTLLHVGSPTLFTLVQTVIGTLFVLLVLNSLLAKVRPQWVFSPAEIMVIFAMMTNSVIVCGSKFLHYLFPTVLWPFYQPGQAGGEATSAHMPWFFAPRDPELIRRFFVGGQSFWYFFRPEILRPWLLPMAFWAAFVFLLLWTMLCLASLVRRQWSDEERITFPIIELPVILAKENNAGALFSNRVLLLGFTLSSVLLSVNYLSSMYPSIPGISLAENDIGARLITASPWSSVNPLLTVWWPYAIGLCFLIPLEVSFSSWFFFILIRLLTVAATALGLRDAGSAHIQTQFPWFGNLSEGAWLGMFVVVLWNARGLIRQHWQALIRREKLPGDNTEAISYRAALWGAAGGFALLVAIGMAAGMRLHVALLAFSLYFIAIVVMTRMYAQIALPLFCMAFFSFTSWTTNFTGTSGLTGPEGTTLTTFYWFDRTYEQLPMAHHLESLVFADRLKQSRKTMFRVVLLSMIVGIVVGIVTLLQIYYDRGAATARVSGDSTWLAGAAWSRYLQWTGSPKPIDAPTLGRTAASAGIVLLLTYARTVWFGFPLHPIGYLFATSYALEWGMWNVIMVTWLVKALIVRYGGLNLYRRAVPFFLGLALGDAVTHLVWGIGLSLAGAKGASPY
jgi:hypothetical protein